MVHMACCIGNVISSIFPIRKERGKEKRKISIASAIPESRWPSELLLPACSSVKRGQLLLSIKTLWRSSLCAHVAAFVLSPSILLKMSTSVLLCGVQQTLALQAYSLSLYRIIGGLIGSRLSELYLV